MTQAKERTPQHQNNYSYIGCFGIVIFCLVYFMAQTNEVRDVENVSLSVKKEGKVIEDSDESLHNSSNQTSADANEVDDIVNVSLSVKKEGEVNEDGDESLHNSSNQTDADNKPSSAPIDLYEEFRPKAKNLNFFLDPNGFVDAIADCIVDDKCHIFYRHIEKTGGTTIEGRLQAGTGQPYQDSCCTKWMMYLFRSNKNRLCRAPFSSYQVDAQDFETVVTECMRINPDGSRAIALMSFREPIQRSLSHIHQMCNKNPFARTTEVLEACGRCSYDSDTDFWDHFIQEQNELYESMHRTIQMDIENVEVMTIETPDIDDFFDILHQRMPKSNFHEKNSNLEKSTYCSFGMKSPMFHGLAPSEKIYRDLILDIRPTK